MITAADFTTVSSPSALTATLVWQLRFPLVFCCGLFLGQARFPPRQLARQMSFRVPVLFVKVIRKPGCDGIDQILLIFAVHDGEPARINQARSRARAEFGCPRRGTSRPKIPLASTGNKFATRPEHFARGFVWEREQQDVGRIDPRLEQIRHAISKRPRLTPSPRRR